MAFGSIEITTITRAQDYTTIKHNEDNKAMFDQTHMVQQSQKDINQKAKEVRTSENAQWQNKKFDAREKGSNEYGGDGGGKRNEARQQKQGQVIVNGHRSFDMKI